jgi:ABC-type glycerol-3-phosphate transport system substrate-binding protein
MRQLVKALVHATIFIGLIGLAAGNLSFGAAPDPRLLRAKQASEKQGYVFITSRDEIIAKARAEGKLRILTGMEPPTMKASAAAFGKTYPFINVQIQEITGTDSAERNILEIRSGAKDWDIHRLSSDRYNEYLPYLLKLDVLGMAENGVLKIPPVLIDPTHRNALAFYSRFQATGYNRNRSFESSPENLGRPSTA